MKVRLLAVGTKMPAWVEEGVATYRKRLPREFALEVQEIAPGMRGKGHSIEKARQREAEGIRACLKRQETVIALEVRGVRWTTEQLAEQTRQWQRSGGNVALLVGGPDGLDPELSQGADHSWSLSPLTLPHPLVRVLLAEQLYRAWTLSTGHPYHR